MKSSCSFVVLFFFAAWYGQWYPLRQVQEASAAGPLTVKLPVNQPQSVYVEGETLFVSVKTNKDCYLRLVYRDVQGESVVIFPNYQHRDGKAKGGVEWLVPKNARELAVSKFSIDHERRFHPDLSGVLATAPDCMGYRM